MAGIILNLWVILFNKVVLQLIFFVVFNRRSLLQSANVRLKNLLAPGTEGGVTRTQPDDKLESIYLLPYFFIRS